MNLVTVLLSGTFLLTLGHDLGLGTGRRALINPGLLTSIPLDDHDSNPSSHPLCPGQTCTTSTLSAPHIPSHRYRILSVTLFTDRK
jgi:hypothetical protein